MQPLSPYVQAYADELVACAPPLSPEQEWEIRQIFAPVLRRLAQQSAA